MVHLRNQSVWSWILLLTILGTAPGIPTAHAAAGGGSPALKQGIAFYNRGYIQKAIPALQKAVKLSPNSEQAQLWLGKAYKKQGGPKNFDLARDAFEQVLSLNPSNVEALVNLAEILSWSPQTRKRAIELLNRADREKPGDPVIIKRLSQILYWEGRYPEALNLVEPIADRFSSDKAWMATYAAILAKTGHADQAVRIFETLLQGETPKTPFAEDFTLRQTYAMALFQNGQSQEARAVYDTLKQKLAALPANKQTDYKLLLSALAYDLDLYEEAVNLDQSILQSMSPSAMAGNTALQLRMARSLLKLQRIPEAVDTFQRLYTQGLLSAKEKMEYADALMNLGMSPEELPSPNLIETLYQEALRDTDEPGAVHLRLARFYGQENGRTEDALREYWLAVNNTPPSGQAPVKREFLDFLKSDKVGADTAEQAFRELLADSPSDYEIKAAYAEFLSYKPARRPEAIRVYMELVNEDPADKDIWKTSLERVLSWDRPKLSMEGVYQEIITLFPDSKEAPLALARAYQTHPKSQLKSLEIYQELVTRFPDDTRIKREWAAALISDEAHRKESLAILKKMTEDNPTDTTLQIAYGKLLSYDHQIAKALKIFDTILKAEPENKDALVGKAYTLMFDAKYLASKAMFQKIRTMYPTDLEVALGLAEANKQIERYDEALKILKEIKLQLKPQSENESPQGTALPNGFLYCDHETLAQPVINKNVVYDFSILPYSGDAPAQAPARSGEPEAYTQMAVPAADESMPNENTIEDAPTFAEEGIGSPQKDYRQATLDAPPTAAGKGISRDLDRLNQSIDRLKQMQANSSGQINQVHRSMSDAKEAFPGAVSVEGENGEGAEADPKSILKAWGQYAAIDYDTNPLLSGMGRFKTDADNLENRIYKELRPMARVGWAGLTQDGEKSTVRLKGYGVPNQLSLSLTPQSRFRLGITPRKLWQPRVFTSPSSTGIVDYSFGGTLKNWDRLTLDGDMALLHFAQSDSTNLIYQAHAKYDFNDQFHMKLGGRRLQNPNSLLSYAGYRPFRGPYDGDLVGQAMENMFFVEFNTLPFRNFDLNAGYEAGLVTGHRIQDNFKQQTFFSFGYTVPYQKDHAVRLGYEFLYFMYDKNATFGFFNLDDGTSKPVVLLDPVTQAPGPTVFGGYFSPTYFFLNALRLDLRGSFKNKLIEYRLGGSLGIQNFKFGNGFRTPTPTSMASTFDGNVLINFTDYLSGYINGEYLDGGGQFNRWRYGAGVIVRPDIRPLSPVFGRI